ncbi:MAG: type II toxin-antitoxin system RatA family toxin [Acidiferrobacterales bacterium]|nr:type II toxin-antitoxin system RatA family toxin [Acidiferrobacterales bacterium]
MITGYTREQMYSLVTDVRSYPQFIKSCTASRVNQIHEDGYTATLEFSYSGIKKRFATRNTVVPHSEISMSLVSGPFRELYGCWKFTDLGENACKVEFEITYDFESSMVEKLSAPLMKHISETMVRSFHEEAKRKYGEQAANQN